MQFNQIQDALQHDEILQALAAQREVSWENPHVVSFDQAQHDTTLNRADIEDAAQRLQRFAPYIALKFPETAASQGLIESELVPIPNFARTMAEAFQVDITPKIYLKKDSHLPISGSVKARGGIYEVLYHAEQLALQQHKITLEDSYLKLAEPELQAFFAQYKIAVASTGNLGLSIGIMAATLGFQCSVHMSHDAKQWKKDKLRSMGVNVIEHQGDYGQAILQGRHEADADPQCYFIDDENSQSLFLGYAVAGQRLKQQLEQQHIIVDAEHPLFVYLPCGVGGAPGGITFGLKHAFGDHVKCIFAEPTNSPCMFLGMYTGLHHDISVQDIGLTNLTIADGLAVGRASGFVGHALARSIDFLYSLSDDEMLHWLRQLYKTENIILEPSALAGSVGFARLQQQGLLKNITAQQFAQGTHIVWATGGGMLPKEEIEKLL
ncbi:D-serine ammonia-lyase [Acinetobacter puyangensis]|uniref:D-serine ammonia-lyase n=1 Tax=Acinetobacter puyangensis TaxID=1096779 RepID=UPI003A4D8D0F